VACLLYQSQAAPPAEMAFPPMCTDFEDDGEIGKQRSFETKLLKVTEIIYSER
ncbi:hypothetical protein P7K49_000291, partial [Saguinus oedipus]